MVTSREELQDSGLTDTPLVAQLLLLASEAQANRHVMTGLVHDAKGPLNNFNLTLALLIAGLARAESSPLPEATLARWRRYIDVLQIETARLADCLNAIQAMAQPDDTGRERTDIVAILRDVVRLLRHEATMREVTIELELPADAACVIGNPRQLQLALLGLTTSVLDMAPDGGTVHWRVGPPGEQNGLIHLQATAAKSVVPPDLAREFLRVGCVPHAGHAGAIAGRMIIEAHGGDVTLESAADGHAGFAIRIARAS